MPVDMFDFPCLDWPYPLNPWPVFHGAEVGQMAAYAARAVSMRRIAAFASAGAPVDGTRTVDAAVAGSLDAAASNPDNAT